MPFVKCLSGFAEVPWSLPIPKECPKISPKKQRPGTSPEGTLALQGSCCEVLPRVRRGTVPGTAPLPLKIVLKTLLGTRWEGTFEWKARLENAERCAETAGSGDFRHIFGALSANPARAQDSYRDVLRLIYPVRVPPCPPEEKGLPQEGDSYLNMFQWTCVRASRRNCW